MEKQQFLITCGEVSAFHIPRWHELPEFDLYMDQVIALAEKYLSVLSADGKGLLTPSMINNYVKSGVLPPPKNKKYNRTHLAMLMIICAEKSVLEISAVSDIIHKSIDAGGIEKVWDQFAQMYETAIATAAKKARLAASASDSDDIFSFIAIENALNAGAARTVALYAYDAIATKTLPEEPTDKEKEKAEKKAEKAEKKAEKSEKKTKQSSTEA
jgi:hypothetical protein